MTMLVLEPGALTPTLSPSSPWATCTGGAGGGNTDADLRRGSGEHERLEVLLPRLHVDRMLIAPATTSALPPTTASSERVPPAKSLMRTLSPSS